MSDQPNAPDPPLPDSTRDDDTPSRIRPGAAVTLHLTLALEDGTEVLSTREGEPLECRIGDGTLAPGLEMLLLDLAPGTDTVLLAEGAAVYGQPDPSLVHDLPRADLPPDFDPQPGQIIAFDTPGGQETPGTVLGVTRDAVRVDFNHPLSRRGLQVHVQVLTVR
jgi:FKBP-type peptidyl-prolyl cis-trans isomerase 2